MAASPSHSAGYHELLIVLMGVILVTGAFSSTKLVLEWALSRDFVNCGCLGRRGHTVVCNPDHVAVYVVVVPNSTVQAVGLCPRRTSRPCAPQSLTYPLPGNPADPGCWLPGVAESRVRLRNCRGLRMRVRHRAGAGGRALQETFLMRSRDRSARAASPHPVSVGWPSASECEDADGDENGRRTAAANTGGQERQRTAQAYGGGDESAEGQT
jgi:hypothetical protein